ICTVFPPRTGGAAVVYDNLARCLARSVSVLAPKAKGDKDHDQRQAYRIRRLWSLKVGRSVSGPRWVRSAYDILVDRVALRVGALCAINWHILRHRPQVVCIGNLKLHWVRSLVRRVWGAPVMFYIHGEEVSLLGNAGR